MAVSLTQSLTDLYLDTDVEADCCVDSSEADRSPLPGCGTPVDMGFQMKTPKSSFQLENIGVLPRETKRNSCALTNQANQAFPGLDRNLNNDTPTEPAFTTTPKPSKPAVCTFTTSPGPLPTSSPPPPCIIELKAGQKISEEMIEDGAHVVFDWDNTLKLYDKETRQLSCRLSREFLLRLRDERGCRLYIISAIRPSSLNLATLLSEVDRLGLTDVFVRDATPSDHVDSAGTSATAGDTAVVRSDYAHMGNVIICGYDKAETFLTLSGFDSSQGHKVVFFDDEEVNITNFSALVPTSRCYHVM